VTYKSSAKSKGPACADVVNAKAAIQKNAPTKILVMVRSIPKGRFLRPSMVETLKADDQSRCDGNHKIAF